MRAMLFAAAAAMASPAAAADFELSVYGGIQSSPHSGVTGTDPVVGDFDFRAGWEGRSFDWPPYYGIRAMWWQPSGWGFGIEFNHAKVYADDETLADSGFSTLEFTDGLNLVTVNAFKRFKPVGKFSPYVGAGVGIAVPHVEVTTPAGRTFEYQITGPAVILVAGASYAFNDRWAVFGEYKGSYSQNKADLTPGGNLETDIVTNAFNLGITYKF